jgi:hypothetical protein
MPVKITLGPEQLALAEAEAHRRQLQNESRGLRGRNKAPDKGEKALKMHLLGCIGEVAVADYLGLQEHLFKAQSPVPGAADLPGNIEVKTRSKHNYDLLVQISDDPNKIFVLTTHEGGEATHIVGWIRGQDAMRKGWIREFVRGRPCYAIPQSELRPPETIVEAASLKPKGRVLGSHEAWLTEEGEDLLLNFSQELADRLGWAPGDVLEWDTVPESSQCIIRKANERTQKSVGSDRPGVDRDDAALSRA